MSVAVSLSSSFPSIPPGRAWRSSLMNAASPGPWLVTSAVSVSALSRYNCFSFWIFFIWEVFFTRAFADAVSSYSFGSLPLLELAPQPEYWPRSKILNTGASVWHQRALCERGTLPRCSTLTLRAAELSDSTVSVRLHIRDKIQTEMGRRR